MKKEHIFGVYINHTTKRFSATARHKDHPHLGGMRIDQEKQDLNFVQLAEGLSKSQADDFKACQIAAYKAAGYEYVSRKPPPEAEGN